jgi:type II secretory pathway component PulF
LRFTREKLYHNVSIMLNAGLTLTRALETSTDAARGRMKRDLQGVQEALSEGEDLSETLEAHPHSFPPVDTMLLGVGHRAGRLTEACELLSHWYGFADRMRRLLFSGLLLPALIYHIAVILIPLPRVILGSMDLAGLIRHMVVSLLWVYVPTALIVIVVRFTPKQGLPRRALDYVSMAIPLLGSGLYHLGLSRFCRAFHMLFATGGLPMEQCVELATQASGSTVVNALVRGGAQSAHDGQPVSRGFSHRLPTGFVETWSVGEESGSLDDAVLRLAEQSAEEAEHRFRQFASALPKLIYFAVCLRMAIAILKAVPLLTRTGTELL